MGMLRFRLFALVVNGYSCYIVNLEKLQLFVLFGMLLNHGKWFPLRKLWCCGLMAYAAAYTRERLGQAILGPWQGRKPIWSMHMEHSWVTPYDYSLIKVKSRCLRGVYLYFNFMPLVSGPFCHSIEAWEEEEEENMFCEYRASLKGPLSLIIKELIALIYNS